MNGRGFMILVLGQSHAGEPFMLDRWVRADLVEDPPVLAATINRMQQLMLEKDVPRHALIWAAWPVNVVLTEPRTTGRGPVASASVGVEGSGLPPGLDPSA